VAENKVAPMYQKKQATAQQAEAVAAWVPWFELLVFSAHGRSGTPRLSGERNRPRWLVPNGLRGVGVVGAAVVPVAAVGVGSVRFF
jgi:hypothetical protein